MRNLSENYHPKLNFWEHNPSYLDVDPFAKLRTTDKSPGKRISSVKMWAVVLACDPKSDFYYLPGKLEKIATAMNRNHRVKIDWTEVNELMLIFTDMYLNQAERSLLSWEKRMFERDEFLEVQEWSFDFYDDSGKLIKGTADQLDRMHGQTAKHYKEYQLIVKELQELAIKDQSVKKSNIQELDV